MKNWYNSLKSNDNPNEIGFLDVKELYDAAYAEKQKARVNLRRFTAMLQKAEELEAAYRAQLAQKRPYAFGRAA